MIFLIAQSTLKLFEIGKWWLICCCSLESLFGGDFVSNKRIFSNSWAFSDLGARIVWLSSISLFVKFSERFVGFSVSQWLLKLICNWSKRSSIFWIFSLNSEMMSSKDFSSIVGGLDEFNSGVVWKELRSIRVGMSDGLGEGLFISVMLLAGFILYILLVLTPLYSCFSFGCHIKI